MVPSNDLEVYAKREMIDSYKRSLKRMKTTPVEELELAYSHFKNENGLYIKGIKLHIATKVLHLYGLINAKRVIIPGFYPKRNRTELTLAKKKLAKLCPVSKFRQFRILPSQVNSISVEHLSLLPPSSL